MALSVLQRTTLDVLGVVAGILYIWVAFALHRREVSPEHRGALRGFILWWAGLGALGLSALIWRRLSLAEKSDVGVYIYTALLIALLLAMLGGLVYYLLILYTGDRKWFTRVVAFYVVFAVALVSFIVMQDPYVGPDEETGEVGLQYHAPLAATHPAGIAISMALLLPPLIAAGAFLMLYFRVRERAPRYRILMVASGIILWFGYSTLGSAVRIASGVQEQGFVSTLVGQMLGVLSGVLVLLAYRPPPLVQRWLEAEPKKQGAAEHEAPRRQAAPLLA